MLHHEQELIAVVEEAAQLRTGMQPRGQGSGTARWVQPEVVGSRG